MSSPGMSFPQQASAQLARLSRWHPAEYLAWAAVAAAFLLFPDRYLLIAEIAVTALFALSLDLILGYAGILSLGHAAFFGLGAGAGPVGRSRGSPCRAALVGP